MYYDIFDDKVGKYEEKITFLKRYGYKCADYIPKKREGREMADSYKILYGGGEAETEVKKSRFIATVRRRRAGPDSGTSHAGCASGRGYP